MKRNYIIKLIAMTLCCLLLLSSCAESETSSEAETTGKAETVTESAAETEKSGIETVDVTWESVGDTTETDETTETADTEETTDEPVTTREPVTTPPPETTKVLNDTEAPFFLYNAYNVTLTRGNAFNLHKYISYIDDQDSDVELIVGGSVDTNTVGTYSLKLTLKDDAGNTSSSNLSVKVVEPVSSGSSGSSGTYTPEPARSFADFTATYKKAGTMVGIDVSRWQGNIDFNKVAAAGCEFVIMRIGGYADGVFEDPYYAANIRNAKAAGLKVGIYWYSEENGAAAVRENASYLYSLLNGEKLDFPIFFDWEDYYNFEDYKMSVRDLNDMFLAFKEEAEARGYKAALYNSKYFLGILWSEEVKGDGVWLAHYIDETTYTGKYFLWQQGLGSIDGISGDVDVDVFYPDRMK